MHKLFLLLYFFLYLIVTTKNEKPNSANKSKHLNRLQKFNALYRLKRTTPAWRYDIELPNPIRIRGRQFRNSTITWRISQYPSFSFFNLANFTAVISRAMAAWSDHAIIDFQENTNEWGRIDIDIQLMESSFDDSCGRTFPRYTMAHTDHDPVKIHFNGAVPWSMGNGEYSFDLFTVAMHEIGHALGLNHSDHNTVMSEYYSGKLRRLTDKDIKAIQALYGVRRPLTTPQPIAIQSTPMNLVTLVLVRLPSTSDPIIIQSTPNSITTKTLEQDQEQEKARLCTAGQFYCGPQLRAMGYENSRIILHFDHFLYKCNQNGEAAFSFDCFSPCVASDENSHCSCTGTNFYCGYELRPMNLISLSSDDQKLYRCEKGNNVRKVQTCSNGCIRNSPSECRTFANILPCNTDQQYCGYELATLEAHKNLDSESIYKCKREHGLQTIHVQSCNGLCSLTENPLIRRCSQDYSLIKPSIVN